MSLRGFGIQTLTTTSQPVFGTTLSAAITGVTADPHTGLTSPGSQLSTSSAAVVNADFFRVGDRVLIGPAAGPFDWAKITKITAGTPPAATLTLQGLTTTHATAQFVILSIPCANFYIQPIAITTAIYVGQDSTAGAASVTIFTKLVPAQVTAGYIWSPITSGTGAVLDTSQLWINGVTATDMYLPSLLMI